MLTQLVECQAIRRKSINELGFFSVVFFFLFLATDHRKVPNTLRGIDAVKFIVLGRDQRATPNQQVSLSPAGKVPFTFRADNFYQDCGVSV